MTEEEQGSEWTFVIDTDEYAGNFEREMCAYLTGILGECGVGEEMAAIARKELPKKILKEFEEIVAQVPDEHGCCRPVTIWPNPNWFNDGMGGHWKRDDNDIKKQLAAYVRSVIDYETPHIKKAEHIIKTLKEGKTVSNWTKKDAERQIKECQREIDKAKSLKAPKRCQAYNSVGIWFDKKPTGAQISLMKERAFKFQEAKRQNKECPWDAEFTINIEGFRLIHHKKSASEEKV